ncbi:S-adenosyl-L-methionine-dependent methyltransferase [Halteromyces radiatus]|uniref:S-adenosyl-L-methionine-dependent methyltransferase n=1 Tax=Halteromyces radiatus TaxID=101107 RepID=UPI00221EE5E9|nr:S-adenosyl-L-methionine-dependent methyltransferase [Halteromyces radiatus]KAI8078738.1 S-adenosyl-L-methionine-dependent methyltransferase [Halteromyces radiatus]
MDELDDINDQTTLSSSTFDISQLPVSFQSFLKDNAIDPKIYTVDQLPRYIRWNTHLPLDQLPTLDQLKTQFKTNHVWKVQAMKGFFGIQLEDNLPRLVDIAAYQQHTIFGIDLSSAIAVEALELQPDDHVLDLCCAPGAKLCMIANVLGLQGTGTVTGVDIASHRLATCRSLVKKYRVGSRVRLYEADGTTFDVPAPSRLGSILFEEDERKNKKRKVDVGWKKPFWAPKTLRHDASTTHRLYDKVLVDAECTHDGSISHILKVNIHIYI